MTRANDTVPKDSGAKFPDHCSVIAVPQAAFFFASLARIDSTSARGVAANSDFV